MLTPLGKKPLSHRESQAQRAVVKNTKQNLPFTKSQLHDLRISFLKRNEPDKAAFVFAARRLCQKELYREAEKFLMSRGIYLRSPRGKASNFKHLLPKSEGPEKPYLITTGRMESQRRKH